MKVSALILLAFTALVSAEVSPKSTDCHCGMFVQLDDEIHRVYSLERVEDVDCNVPQTCKDICAQEFNTLTGGGDLNHMMDSGYSVGQEICLNMATDQINTIWEATVYGYAMLCHGPWVYDGASTINKLCCHEGFYKPCE